MWFFLHAMSVSCLLRYFCVCLCVYLSVFEQILVVIYFSCYALGYKHRKKDILWIWCQCTSSLLQPEFEPLVLPSVVMNRFITLLWLYFIYSIYYLIAFYELGGIALHLMLQPEFEPLVLPSVVKNRLTTLLLLVRLPGKEEPNMLPPMQRCKKR